MITASDTSLTSIEDSHTLFTEIQNKSLVLTGLSTWKLIRERMKQDYWAKIKLW
jgi:hypothetical protein